MSNHTVETIDISPTLRVRIEYDRDPESPAEWSQFGKIAYCSSRETLGTENVSRDRLYEISKGIRDGSLIGLPVYAYVHSGATIRTAPYSCPWDSGQSGFVYASKDDAIKEFGKKILTAKAKAKAIACLEAEVESFDQWLRGDVYGYVVERLTLDEDGEVGDAEDLDSCWGFYGLDYVIEEAKAIGAHYLAEEVKEAAERAYWAERDVFTEAA